MRKHFVCVHLLQCSHFLKKLFRMREKDSALSRLQGEVSMFQNELKQVQAELESQKTKNNVSIMYLVH